MHLLDRRRAVRARQRRVGVETPLRLPASRSPRHRESRPPFPVLTGQVSSLPSY